MISEWGAGLHTRFGGQKFIAMSRALVRLSYTKLSGIAKNSEPELKSRIWYFGESGSPKENLF